VLSVGPGNPPPADNPTNLSYSVSGHTLTLTWPEDHLGWFAQSNSVTVAQPGWWYDVPGSDLTTNLAIVLSPFATSVFYRLRHP
jgi:hypothetical protein